MPRTQNPYDSGNVDLSGLEGISKIGDRYRENSKREQLGKDVGEALESGNYKKLTEMAVQYPNLTPVLKNLAGFKSDATRQMYGEGLGSVLTSMEGMRTESDDGFAYPTKSSEVRGDAGELLGMDYDQNTQNQMLALDESLEDTAMRIEQTGGNPQHIREAQKMLVEGDLEGAYNQARTGLMMGNEDLYNTRYGMDKDAPSSVQEWKYYEALSDEDKKRYQDMKRQGYKVRKINGVDTLVPTNYVEGTDVETLPLTTLPEEMEATEALASAKETGVQDIKSKWQEFNKLRDTEGGRVAGRKKAQYFYDKIASGEMNTGGMRKALSYLPFTFTEQGAMDEEFNAFAETSARQALKESGEIRPTDADVKGMKQAMFGIGRDEKVNERLLQQFMESIDRNDHKAYLAKQATKYRKTNPVKALSKEDYEARKNKILNQ